MQMMRRKKGQAIMNAMASLAALGIGLFVAGVVLTFLGLVNTNISDTLTVNSTAYNISTTATKAGYNVSTFLSPVGYIGVAAVIIMMIIGGFAVFTKLNQ